MAEEPKPFVRKAFLKEDEVLGARWWHQGMAASSQQHTTSRRSALRNFLIFGGAAAALGTGGYFLFRGPREVEQTAEALALQQKEGWDVGDPGGPLEFPGQTARDCDETESWRGALDSMPALVAPSSPRLVPYQVQTLFQSLGVPASAALRASLRPIHDPAMDVAYGQGRALTQVFESVQYPTDTAVILDLPGAHSVAVAAAMIDNFDPVYGFDNWPHPLGVVPSHLPLCAILYYAPILRRAKAARPATRVLPPVFVLDRNRLAAYQDQSAEFDNRYVAKLPPIDGWNKLGIKHILYVTPDGEHLTELDDLNDEMVAFDKAGIDVKVVALTDFKEDQSTDGTQAATALLTAPPRDGGATIALTNDGGTTATTTTVVHRHYYYGGSPYFAHYYFWSSYGWHPPPRYVTVPGRPAPSAPPPPPTTVSRGATFRPTPRATVFSSRTVGGVASGVGKQRPSGFGRVSYRASAESGRFVGTNFRRSGSFGRSRSSSSA